MRTAIIIVGVSGSGKSAVARIVSARLGWRLTDGADLLLTESITKLRAGRPLGEIDHLAWAGKLRDHIDGLRGNLVLTCSALRRSHRDVLRQAKARVVFVELEASRDLLGSRTTLQSTPFVPRAQLEAQLATLESLAEDEDGVRVPASQDPGRVAQAIVEALGFKL